MDYKGIQEIIKTMNSSDVTSLEIETKDIRISMKKGEERETIATNKNQINIDHSNSDIKVEKKTIDQEALKEIQNTDVENDSFITINSPIVGTFYASPSPEDDAFISIGSKIKKGETLCIIEAMKLMNEIEAEENGEILEVLVKNEEMVEYGQPLFKVRV